MSFDLFIWHESQPITAAEARAKLERWDKGSDGVFDAHPAVGRFYDALLDRFPPLESFSDADIDRLGVWSVTPERSQAIVAVSCVWSRADEVGEAVQALATEHGLVCYEPGDHLLSPNAPGYRPAFTLSIEHHPTVADPDDRRLERAVGRLGVDNTYVTLERADGWFVQIGYGRARGVPPGTYALEYQEGSLDRHFCCQTTDRLEAAKLVREFRAGDETWKRRHVWRPL
ncbi:hypothetical protein ACIBSW_23050 [Actinoplanes sp. NPDC049668]|uniref:hypothetical protein n=1 Tax=unclassified Actinoplanes TaxID=2626549 RepID=UPI0033B3D80B